MTREEAVDVLVGEIATDSERENEALDMAIEALRKWEPVVRCKDCDRVHIDFDGEGRTRYSCNHYNPLRIMVSDDGMGYCSNGRRRE